MRENRIRWIEGAKAVGGLAAVLTLLAHFILPELPLTLLRIQLLLLLIGVLLGIDMLTEIVNVNIQTPQNKARSEGEKK